MDPDSNSQNNESMESQMDEIKLLVAQLKSQNEVLVGTVKSLQADHNKLTDIVQNIPTECLNTVVKRIKSDLVHHREFVEKHGIQLSNEVKMNLVNTVKSMHSQFISQDDLIEMKDGIEEELADVRDLEENIGDIVEIRIKDFQNDIERIAKMVMGEFGVEVAFLENTDMAHGTILQRMITLKATDDQFDCLLQVLRPSAIGWRNVKNKGFTALYLTSISPTKNAHLHKQLKLRADKATLDIGTEDLQIGKYLTDLLKCTIITPNLTQQCTLLHQILSEEILLPSIIGIVIRRMNEKALKMSHKKTSMNALQFVYAYKPHLVNIVEVFCSSSFRELHKDDKILGSFLPSLILAKDDINEQGKLIHDCVVRTVSKKIITIIINRSHEKALEWDKGDLLKDYLPRVLKASIISNDIVGQSTILNDAINEADRDVLKVILNWSRKGSIEYIQPNTGMNALQLAYAKGDHRVISMVESRCSCSLISAHNGHKIIASYLAELCLCTIVKDDIDWQGALLERVLKENSTFAIIVELLKYLPPKVLSWKNQEGASFVDIAVELGYPFIIFMRLGTYEDIQRNFEKKKLLPLTTRVVRGKDWNGNYNDGMGPGTVVGKHENIEGYYYVKWDNNGHTYGYNFGHQNKFKVKVMNYPA